MKIFIILDNSKDCYDAGGIYYDCFLTREEAEKELQKFESVYRKCFEILEEELGDNLVVDSKGL